MDTVRHDLQRVVESLIELGVVVYDYPGDEPHSQELLQRKLADFVADAQDVAKSADKLDVSVPIDILGYIDNGRNPDIYSREFVELVTKQNQNVSGQLSALEAFHEALTSDIKEQFPALAEHLN